MWFLDYCTDGDRQRHGVLCSDTTPTCPTYPSRVVCRKGSGGRPLEQPSGSPHLLVPRKHASGPWGPADSSWGSRMLARADGVFEPGSTGNNAMGSYRQDVRPESAGQGSRLCGDDCPESPRQTISTGKDARHCTSKAQGRPVEQEELHCRTTGCGNAKHGVHDISLHCYRCPLTRQAWQVSCRMVPWL